jgi:hypothetical protein
MSWKEFGRKQSGCIGGTVLALLKKEYILIHILKSLASIISMCNLHVTFLSKITPRYFTLFTNGIFRPFSVRWDSGGRRLREK